MTLFYRRYTESSRNFFHKLSHGLLMIGAFLLAATTVRAQANCSGLPCGANPDGNGPALAQAKLYCSNSGKVDNGIIACTPAADTDGCGLDASKPALPSIAMAEWLSATAGTAYQKGMHIQWIKFYTPVGVNAFKIQGVGKSDAWAVYWLDQNAPENPDIKHLTSITSSSANQWATMSNPQASLDKIQTYYIAFFYKKTSNGSINFKVKECEALCTPSIVCPAPITVNCDPSMSTTSWVNQAQIQSCEAAVSLKLLQETEPFSCELGQITQYTFQLVHTTTSEVLASCQTSITSIDTLAPVILQAPVNGKDDCGTASGFDSWLNTNGGAIAQDACSTVRWSYQIQETAPCGKTVTFIATDACGNSATATAYYQLSDKEAPVASQPAEHLVLDCANSPSANEALIREWLGRNGGAQFSDACTSGITFSNNYPGESKDCIQIITFTAMDACGNSATTSANIQFKDNGNVSITAPPVDYFWTCDAHDETVLQQWLAVQGAAQVQASCGELSWTHNFEKLNPGCDKQEVLFTGSNPCGASITLTAYIIRQDQSAPVWERTPQSVNTECDANASQYVFQGWLENHGGAIVNDACGDITWNYSIIEEIPGNCPGTFTRKVVFVVSDACGNTTSSQATFTVEDTQAPIIVKDPYPLFLQCNESDPQGKIAEWMRDNAGAMVKDDCSDVTWNNPQLKFEPSCQHSGEAVFSFTDQCGNMGSFTAFIYIQDQEPPVFTTAPQDVSVLCDGEGNLVDLDRWITTSGGSVATDACGNVTVTHNYPGQENGCSRTLIFTATDACGNATEAMATFTIIDSIPPVISQPATPLQVSCGQDQVIQDWLDQHGGAKATDNCGEVQWSNDYNGQIKNCKATVSFTATDACGNVSATTADITFLDAQPPVLEKPAAPMVVECDGSGNQGILQYWLGNHGGAVATDACGPVEWTDDFSGLQPQCGQTGQVTVNFTATDGCGNSVSTAATFTIEDTTPPFLLNGQDYTAACNDPAAMDFQTWLEQNGNFWVIEDCSEVTFDKEVMDTQMECGNSWSRQVKFTATDACGNATSEILTYRFVDIEGPALQMPADLTIACSADYLRQYQEWVQHLNNNIHATDACSEFEIRVDAPLTPLTCGVTPVTIKATDACGNTTEAQVLFEIKDDTAPVLIQTPKDLSITCSGDQTELENWLNLHGGALATDACSTVTWEARRLGRSDCLESVNFIATDACGNTVSTVGTIHWLDDQAPVFSQAPTDLSLVCGTDPAQAIATWLNANAGATANDKCSSLTWSHNYQNSAGIHCNQPLTVQFTATDACGNTATTTAKIITVDNQAPVVLAPPQPLVIHCEDPYKDAKIQAWINNAGGASVQDACSNITWNSDNNPVLENCGTHPFQWVVSDQCGNSTIVQGIIEVQDIIPPQGNCPELTYTVPCKDATQCDLPSGAVLLEYAGLISTYFKDNCSQPIVQVLPLQSSTPATIGFEVLDDCGNRALLNCTLKLIYEQPPVNTNGYCSFTQGGWGNAGGFFPTRSPENSRPAIIKQLLEVKGPLTIGKAGRSITFNSEHCILNALPGNGNNVPLAAGNFIASYPACDLGANAATNSGRLDNNLGTNTVALTLNVWYNEVRNGSNLFNYKLDGACFQVPAAIRQELISQRLPLTVGGFLELSNLYLGGKLANTNTSFGGTLTNFTTTLNEYWHECKPVPSDCNVAPLNELQVAPNPAETFTNVQYTTTSNTTGLLTLMNTTSQVLYQEKINIASGSNTYPLPLDQYPSGWYFIQLSTTTGESITKTIFVQ